MTAILVLPKNNNLLSDKIMSFGNEDDITKAKELLDDIVKISEEQYNGDYKFLSFYPVGLIKKYFYHLYGLFNACRNTHVRQFIEDNSDEYVLEQLKEYCNTPVRYSIMPNLILTPDIYERCVCNATTIGQLAKVSSRITIPKEHWERILKKLGSRKYISINNSDLSLIPIDEICHIVETATIRYKIRLTRFSKDQACLRIMESIKSHYYDYGICRGCNFYKECVKLAKGTEFATIFYEKDEGVKTPKIKHDVDSLCKSIQERKTPSRIKKELLKDEKVLLTLATYDPGYLVSTKYRIKFINEFYLNLVMHSASCFSHIMKIINNIDPDLITPEVVDRYIKVYGNNMTYYKELPEIIQSQLNVDHVEAMIEKVGEVEMRKVITYPDLLLALGWEMSGNVPDHVMEKMAGRRKKSARSAV